MLPTLASYVSATGIDLEMQAGEVIAVVLPLFPVETTTEILALNALVIETFKLLLKLASQWFSYALSESKVVGWYIVDGYDLYSVNGSYPAMVPGYGSIGLELYEVDDFTLAQLDHIEGVSHGLYSRVEIDGILTYVYQHDVSNYKKINVWRN